MVYGPIAATLVEMFPTRIRYTSMCLPYHIGNGWFGGLLPTTAFAIVAQTGNIYYGLWYPIVIARGDLRGRPALRAGDQGPRYPDLRGLHLAKPLRPYQQRKAPPHGGAFHFQDRRNRQSVAGGHLADDPAFALDEQALRAIANS